MPPKTPAARGRNRGRGGGGAPPPPSTPARGTRSRGPVNIDLSVYPDETVRRPRRNAANNPANNTMNQNATIQPAQQTVQQTAQPTIQQPAQQPAHHQVPVQQTVTANNAANANGNNINQGGNQNANAANPAGNLGTTAQVNNPNTAVNNNVIPGVNPLIPTQLPVQRPAQILPNVNNTSLANPRAANPNNAGLGGGPGGNQLVSGNAPVAGPAANPNVAQQNVPILQPAPAHIPRINGAHIANDGGAPGPNNPQTQAGIMPPRPPPPPTSFWPTFWEQVRIGLRYFSRKRALLAFALAGYLLVEQLCSVGSLCEQNPTAIVVAKAFRDYFWSYTALWLANLLAISGTFDLFESIVTVVNNIGVRAARRDRPIFNNWLEILSNPQRLLDLYLQPIFLDIADNVVEPLLILTLTFNWGEWLDVWLWRGYSAPIQLVIANTMLHMIKWLCQTIEVIRGPFPEVPEVKKPLVVIILLLCAVLSAGIHSTSDPGGDTEGPAVAQAYWNSSGRSHGGQEYLHNFGHLFSQPAQSMARIVHRVTHRVVTEWVQPTPMA